MKTRLLSKSILVLFCIYFFLLTACEDKVDVHRVVVTQVSDITANSALCTVQVDLNNSSKIVERGIIYDSKEWKNQIVKTDAHGGDGSFSLSLENLQPGTVYGVRGYAKNSEGVVYSTVYSFKTPLKESTMEDVEGNVYKTIIIGKQEWMVENLRTTKFNEGTSISRVTANGAWAGANNNGAYCYYSNSADNLENYGVLYNWRAVNRRIPAGTGGLVLAPEGWRVPSMEDWNALKDHLINHLYGYQGVQDNVIAKSMAATSLWLDCDMPGTIGADMASNNTSGFNAVPGGYRTERGVFNSINEKAYYWSSDAVEGVIKDISYFVTLSFNSNEFMTDSKEFEESTGGNSKLAGFSVRCVRDVE